MRFHTSHHSHSMLHCSLFRCPRHLDCHTYNPLRWPANRCTHELYQRHRLPLRQLCGLARRLNFNARRSIAKSRNIHWLSGTIHCKQTKRKIRARDVVQSRSNSPRRSISLSNSGTISSSSFATTPPRVLSLALLAIHHELSLGITLVEELLIRAEVGAGGVQ